MRRLLPPFSLGLCSVAVVLFAFDPAARATGEAPASPVPAPPATAAPAPASTAARDLADKLTAMPDAEFAAYLPGHLDLLTPDAVVAVLRAGRGLGMHGDNTGQARLFDRAGQMARATGDRLSQARVQWRLAGMEGEFHHTDKALTMIDGAIRLAKECQAPAKDLAGMLGSRIVMLGYQGDYARAMTECDGAMRLAREANSPEAQMAVLTTLINIYQRQGQPAQSLPYLEQTRRLAEGNDHMMLYVDGNYASTYHQLGELDKEQASLQKALASARQVGDDNMVAQFLSALAEDAREAGDYPAAHEHLAEALILAAKVGNDHARVDAQIQLAQLEAAQGHRALAIAAARTALAGAGETDERESLARAQDILGQALAANGQTAEAAAAYRAAMATIEGLRADTAGGEESSQANLQQHVDPYQRLTALLVADGQFLEAFAVAESAKARVLRDILQNGHMDLDSVLSDTERERRTAAEERIATLNRRLLQASGESKVAGATAQHDLDAARVAWRNLEDELLAAHPDVRRRQVIGQAPAAILEQATKGDAGTVLLEFASNPDGVTLFVAGPGTLALDAHALPITEEGLRGEVESFRDALAGRSLGWKEGAAKLGRTLLGPVADRLEKAQRVVIVPDGPLWDLPFQALAWRSGECLVDRLPVSYAPSAGFLAQVRRRSGEAAPGKGPTAPRLLAMGNPALGKEGESQPAAALMGGALSPLPFAEDEVRRLGAIYGATRSDVFVGAQAREQVFKRDAANYDILHLATHGLLNDANPLYSCLLMAQTDLASGEDGLLEAREIMDLHLHARLAVLAACETARGRAGAGEGQLGLSWALMVAGCPASVVSQWKVDSRSNVELMLELHRQLRAGKGADEALRLAALALRKMPGYENPFYWAPFVVVGDGR